MNSMSIKVQFLSKPGNAEHLTMLDIDTSQAKLPFVKVERKGALNIRTSTVQLMPTVFPLFKRKSNLYDKTKEHLDLYETESRIKRVVWAERIQDPPVSRYWESTSKKSIPRATQISYPHVVEPRKNDLENVPVVRSKSAPTTLVYLDKSGNISPRTKGENRPTTRSCRGTILGRGSKETDLRRGHTDIVNYLTGYAHHKTKEIPALNLARGKTWNDVHYHKRCISESPGKKCSKESAPCTSCCYPDKYNCVDTHYINQSERDICDQVDKKAHVLQHVPTLKHAHTTVGCIREITRTMTGQNSSRRAQTEVLNHLKGYVVHERRKVKPAVTFIEEEVDVESSEDDNRSAVKVAGLFHNVIHFVRMVIRLFTSMTEYSAELTARSATEDQYHALNTSKQVKEMAFNKTAFEKRKGFYKVPRWAKIILGKEADERTEPELRRIHALLRGLKSFDKFTEKIQLSMCRAFRYISVGSGRILLRQGHVGLNFYFLYTGSVFVNITDTDMYGNKFASTAVVLRRGDAFGELALLQDIKRTATITCREDCELLVVDKETFAKVCPKIFEREMEEKMSFLSQMPLFSPKFWSKEIISKLCFDTQIQEYKTNKIIVADHSKDDWIYVCMDGKCQIIRRLNLGEEIEWRKMQLSALGDLSSRERGDETDARDARASVIERRTPFEDDDAESTCTNEDEGKEKLLMSMGMDYKKSRKFSVSEFRQLIDYQPPPEQPDKQVEKGKRPQSKKKGQEKDNAPPQGEGLPTFTSFIRQSVASGKDYLYLNIKTLKQDEVFDLTTVLDGQKGHVDTSGSYMLVSIGARIMRIRRTSFFKHVTPPGLEHARKITKRHKLPHDDVLLRCYSDQLNWQVYKQMVLNNTYALQKHEKITTTNAHVRLSHNGNSVDNSIDKDEAKKKTIKEIEHILPAEDPEAEVENWKKLETLSNKVTKYRKKHKSVAFQLDPEYEAKREVNRTSQEKEVTSRGGTQNAPYKMAAHVQHQGQRRGTVATGDLRRENLRQQSPRRRLSQPGVDFAMIQEEEDGFMGDN